MPHSKTAKDVRMVIKAAIKAGWRVEQTGKGWKVYPPHGKGRPMTIHGSPTPRGRVNMIADFKREGLDLNA